MKIQAIEITEIYNRTLEVLDENLIMFEIKSKNKKAHYHYHYLYQDNRKPPMDLAINPNDGVVGYVSFFIQDEKIINCNFPKINYIKSAVLFDVSQFSIDNRYIENNSDFSFFLSNKDLLIIDKSNNDSLFAYEIDNTNYLIFDSMNNFRGLLLKDITSHEILEIERSNCV